MLATLTAVLAMASGATCSGAEPAITKITTSQPMSAGGINTYTLDVTVANVGSTAEPGNALESVAIFLDGQKKDQKGLPPLRPGQTYSFPYEVHRSADAAAGTTTVRFHLVNAAAAPGPQCAGAKDSRRIVI